MELKDIKDGQYLYYTERGNNDNSYADSLIHIQDVCGVLMAHPISTNWKGSYINETLENWGEDLPVASFFIESHWFPTSYVSGDPSEWMGINYPLSIV
jgi:hypothetical protein